MIRSLAGMVLTLACMIPIEMAAQDQSGLGASHYRIFDTKLGREVPLQVVVDQMETHDILFFGEEHNDSVAHYLQATLWKMMHDRYGKRLALSMEMFDRDVQSVMDEYLSGSIREKHFLKDARVWSNYRDYRPMVELAKLQGLDVICANAASRYTNLAGRQGMKGLLDLPETSKANLAPLPYPLASGAYYNKLMAFMNGGHSSPTDSTGQVKPPVAAMGGFDLIAAQSLWDATMAWSIASYAKRKENRGKKVMHVNGRFHSDERLAIVTQLARYAKRLRPLVISCGPSEDFKNPNWQTLMMNGDFIIITDPTVPRTYEN